MYVNIYTYILLYIYITVCIGPDVDRIRNWMLQDYIENWAHEELKVVGIFRPPQVHLEYPQTGSLERV